MTNIEVPVIEQTKSELMQPDTAGNARCGLRVVDVLKQACSAFIRRRQQSDEIMEAARVEPTPKEVAPEEVDPIERGHHKQVVENELARDVGFIRLVVNVARRDMERAADALKQMRETPGRSQDVGMMRVLEQKAAGRYKEAEYLHKKSLRLYREAAVHPWGPIQWLRGESGERVVQPLHHERTHDGCGLAGRDWVEAGERIPPKKRIAWRYDISRQGRRCKSRANGVLLALQEDAYLAEVVVASPGMLYLRSLSRFVFSEKAEGPGKVLHARARGPGVAPLAPHAPWDDARRPSRSPVLHRGLEGRRLRPGNAPP